MPCLPRSSRLLTRAPCLSGGKAVCAPPQQQVLIHLLDTLPMTSRHVSRRRICYNPRPLRAIFTPPLCLHLSFPLFLVLILRLVFYKDSSILMYFLYFHFLTFHLLAIPRLFIPSSLFLFPPLPNVLPFLLFCLFTSENKHKNN